MLKYPCLILDHDDTVVKSEETINFPYFAYILDRFRPGTRITQEEYMNGCFYPGFSRMCEEKYHFTEAEMNAEYAGWMEYIKTHIPDPFPGIERIIRRQKENGGVICVVSHSSKWNISRDYQAHFGMEPDDIFGWDYPKELRKPSPYPLLQIMKKYQFNPKQLLVVDDMKPAYTMCRSVGVPIGFAAWSRKGYPQISNEMRTLCDYSFDTVADLEKFLFL